MKISITNEVRQVDEALFEHLKRFRPKDFFVPINRDNERATFFEAVRKHQVYNPVFQYKKNDEQITRIKAGISKLHLENHPLQQIYNDMIRERCMQLELIENRDPELFTTYSKKVFQQPSQELFHEAVGILKRYKSADDTGIYMGIKLLAEKIRKRLAIDRIEGWSISETDENVWISEVDHVAKKILLEQGIIVNQDVVEHLVRRCIEVSIFRSKNAERQPLRMFELGLSHHEETEAGLALEMSIGFGLFHSMFLIRAARGVVASHFGHEYSFYETFQQLCKYVSSDIAYDLSERVKIGLMDTSKKGGLISEHLALQGRKKIQVMQNRDLYYLYTGNVSYEHLDLIQDLISENILFEPAFVPHFLYEK